MFRIISLALLVISSSAFASDTDFADKVLIASVIAEELNESTPVRIDTVTVLEEITADKWGDIVYKYSVSVSPDKRVATTAALGRMQSSIKMGVCSEPEARGIIDSGMAVKFRYYAETGEYMRMIATRASDCIRLGV